MARTLEAIEAERNEFSKVRFELIPPQAEAMVAAAFTAGAAAHGEESWRAASHSNNEFLGKARRHLSAYQCGERRDADSGLHPLAHTIADLMILLEREVGGIGFQPRHFQCKVDIHRLDEPMESDGCDEQAHL